MSRHSFSECQGGKLKQFQPIVTKVATWEPTNGFLHFDKLFPHIEHGFRNRTVPIAVFNVSKCFVLTFYNRYIFDSKKLNLKLVIFDRIHHGKLSRTMMPEKLYQCMA